MSEVSPTFLLENAPWYSYIEEIFYILAMIAQSVILLMYDGEDPIRGGNRWQ